MKTFLGMLTLTVIAGCYSHKEVQVEMVKAELIRIDTVYRFRDQVQQLTWRDFDNLEYISFADLGQRYQVGIKMTVLRTR